MHASVVVLEINLSHRFYFKNEPKLVLVGHYVGGAKLSCNRGCSSEIIEPPSPSHSRIYQEFTAQNLSEIVDR
jgi:hypothetical protein